MRSSALLAATLAVGAFCSPFAKPFEVVDVQIVTVYKTLTVKGSRPAPTKAPEPVVVAPKIDFEEKEPKVEFVPVYTPKPVIKEPEPEPKPVVKPAPEPEPEPEPVYQPKAEPEPAPTSPEPSYGDDYKGKCLKHHNMHRANHSVNALEWDDGLAATAQKHASTCTGQHNTEMDGGGYGQNIARGVAPEKVSYMITDMFYNGEYQLFAPEQGKPQPSSSYKLWGHYTQILWKDTTSVGCATVDCPSIGYFTVCNYKGPGNYQGEYDQNVLPGQGAPIAFG